MSVKRAFDLAQSRLACEEHELRMLQEQATHELQRLQADEPEVACSRFGSVALLRVGRARPSRIAAY